MRPSRHPDPSAYRMPYRFSFLRSEHSRCKQSHHNLIFVPAHHRQKPFEALKSAAVLFHPAQGFLYSILVILRLRELEEEGRCAPDFDVSFVNVLSQLQQGRLGRTLHGKLLPVGVVAADGKVDFGRLPGERREAGRRGDLLQIVVAPEQALEMQLAIVARRRIPRRGGFKADKRRRIVGCVHNSVAVFRFMWV